MSARQSTERALLREAGATTLRRLVVSTPKMPPVGQPYAISYDIAYDATLRQQELEQMEAMFKSADGDGSGEINFQEFEACLAQPETFRILNRRFGLQRHEAPRIFRALDGDGSGQISIEEWVDTCRILMSIVKEGDVITNWRLHSLKERLREQEQLKSASGRCESKVGDSCGATHKPSLLRHRLRSGGHGVTAQAVLTPRGASLQSLGALSAR